MVAVGIHEPERGKTIEPGVGDAFDKRVAAFVLQSRAQFVHLGDLLPEFRRISRQDVIEPCADELAELVPRVLREGFEGGLIHDFETERL